MMNLKIGIFLLVTCNLISLIGFSQKRSSAKLNPSDEFELLNKTIKFADLWNLEKKGVYSGKVSTRSYQSNVFGDLTECSEDLGTLHNTKEYEVFINCTDIIVYDKITKNYFMVWYVPIQRLGDCLSISSQLTKQNVLIIKYYSDNVFVEIDLNKLNYRIIVN